jgi:NADH-quinone oxidoreductase subunit G
VFYGSEGIGLEASQALAQSCANLLMVTNHTRKVNNGLIAVWPRANDQGAWEIGFRPLTNLIETTQQFDSLYIVAADPVGDDPTLAETIRNAGFVVVQDLFLTETAKLADVVLPAQPFTEREGTFTSGERRVQRFYPGVVRNEFKPDYAITAGIAKLAGLNVEAVPLRIFNHLAAKVPAFAGLDYRQLAQVTEQWPIVGRADLYYGGTLYANAQGLGVQLSLPTQLPQLAWPDLPEMQKTDGSLLAVPINILYDRGQMIHRSKLLQLRIPRPDIMINPADAERLNITGGSRMNFTLNGNPVEAEVRLNELVPAGVVLVPRSMGLPIHSPTLLEIKV